LPLLREQVMAPTHIKKQHSNTTISIIGARKDVII